MRKTIFKVAMAMLGLGDYVKTHIKGGYDAPYADGLFSKGQLQLLSTARALAQNQPIILLDEISANLDSDTEKQVMALFQKAFRGKTVISISRRLNDLGFFPKTVRAENQTVALL